MISKIEMGRGKVSKASLVAFAFCVVLPAGTMLMVHLIKTPLQLGRGWHTPLNLFNPNTWISVSSGASLFYRVSSRTAKTIRRNLSRTPPAAPQKEEQK